MNVSLPQAWKRFVADLVSEGEFRNASEVVREALRLLRDQQEGRAREEMQATFAGVDRHGGPDEPTPKDRALIKGLVRQHRKGKGRR